jgi:hypothetical protein
VAFSLLDVMVSRTMAAALEALPLSQAASAALQGENALRSVLDAVMNYERVSGMARCSPRRMRERCPTHTRTRCAGCRTSLTPAA